MSQLRPTSELDVQVLLNDKLELKPKDFEKCFDVEENESEIVLMQKDFIKQPLWGDILAIVKEWGGKFAIQPRRFIIPKPTKAEPKVIPIDKIMPPNENEANQLTLTIVPIKAILESPFQYRTKYNERKIAELAESIKSHGIIEPLIVRQNHVGAYELIAGHRRLRAAKKVGLTEVPVIPKQLTDEEAIFLQIIENLQNEDVSDYDTGKKFYQLTMKDYSQEQIAKGVGISRQHVTRIIDHYRFCDLTFAPLGANVDFYDLKERQTRSLRSHAKEETVKSIIEELKPNKIDSKVLKEVWIHLHVNSKERNRVIQAFLTEHDFLTSLLKYDERGPFGDTYFPGNVPGFLLVELIHHFKPKNIFDPMDGGKTTRDVCLAMDVEYFGNDLKDEKGYDLVSVPEEKIPLSEMTFFHPPYWDLIKYSSNPQDLSNAKDWNDFCKRVSTCIEKLLPKTKRLVVLIGDVIKSEQFLTPLGVLLKYESKIERILVREYKTVTGQHGFYEAIHRGEIPQTHDYLVLLKGGLCSNE